MQKLLGEEEFKKVRRSWDYILPNGESLKMVYERVVPFFLLKILPLVKQGKNVLVVAHGNSLRALTKNIANVREEDIPNLEFPFGGIITYELDDSGHMINKDTKQIDQKQMI